MIYHKKSTKIHVGTYISSPNGILSIKWALPFAATDGGAWVKAVSAHLLVRLQGYRLHPTCGWSSSKLPSYQQESTGIPPLKTNISPEK